MAQEYILNGLNLQEVLFGSPQRLRYVERFSNCRRIYKENVAEHQYFTTLFSLLIGYHCIDAGMDIKIGKVLTKALIHDVEECYTGDIIRPMKYSSEEIRKKIEEVAHTMAHIFFESLTANASISRSLCDVWRNSKSADLEGRIVKFSDFLSVLSYVSQEIRNGNQEILNNLGGLKDYASGFCKKEFDFLGSLPAEALAITRKLIDSRGAI